MNNLPQIIKDTSHWQNLTPPLAPNLFEISLYEKYIEFFSPVCLLGMTKELVDLCDVAVDLNPIQIKESLQVIKCDWNDLCGDFGVIIGDGVLNFTGLDFVHKALKLAKRAIFRVFMEKQPGMKYATIFLKEFPGCNQVIVTQKNIVMTVWDRQ